MTIRPFLEADYPALAVVSNAAYPDYPQTPAEERERDEKRPEKVRWGRLVAEDAGKLVGYGFWGNNDGMFHPQKFGLDIAVTPEVHGAGFGRALYEACQEAMKPFDPILYRCQARENDERSVRFVQERGFEEKMREWESRLDPMSFVREDFVSAEARVAGQGIAIKSLTELQETPGWEQKLYALDCAVISGMPMTDVYTPPDFDDWRKNCLENSGFWPGGYFVALDGDDFVGESTLWTQQSGPDLYVGATGVLPAYQRRGIALALKLHACQAAKARGVRELKTWNATTNVGMLSINEKLGFVRQPAWICFEKSL
jgi:GNAT superfamily N-acetyltransferase